MAEHLGEAAVSQNLAGVQNGIIRLASPLGGKLDRLDVILGGGASETGVSTFRVNINGAEAGAVSINPGVTSGYADNLNALVARKNIITVDATLVPIGGLTAPIYFLFSFSDAQGVIRRGEVVYTTPILANNATNNAGALLGRGFVLYRLETSAPARVRVYSRAAARTADAGRAWGVPPARNTGVILDEQTAAGNLSIDLAPFVQGANLEAVVTDEIAISITNVSGVAQAITVTLTRAAFEGTGVGDAPFFQVEEADGNPSLQIAKLLVAPGDLVEVSPGVGRLKTAGDAALIVSEVADVPLVTATNRLFVSAGDLEILADPAGAARIKTASDVVIPPPPTPTISVREVDTAPTLADIIRLVVDNGDLTDLGGGEARIRTAAYVLGLIAQASGIAGLDAGALVPYNQLPLAAGDASGALNALTVLALNGRDVTGIPTAGGTVSDNFNDNNLDVSLWNEINPAYPLVEASQRLEITTWNGGAKAGFYTPVLDFTGRTLTVKITMPSVINNSNDFYVGIGNGVPEHQAGERFTVQRSSSNFRTSAYNNIDGDTFGAVAPFPWNAGVTLWLRFFHDTAAARMRIYYSTDGVIYNLLESFMLRAGHPNLAACRFGMSMTLSASPPVIMDDFTTDIPAADPLAARDLYALLWKASAAQFQVLRTLGIIPYVASGAPIVGAPLNLPAGHTLAYYEGGATRKMHVWNIDTGAWDEQAF